MKQIIPDIGQQAVQDSLRERNQMGAGRGLQFPHLTAWTQFLGCSTGMGTQTEVSLLDSEETEAARMFRAEYQKEFWRAEKDPLKSLAKY